MQDPIYLIRNKNCHLCPGYTSAKHICMVGKGNQQAKIFLIGESPGEDEDRKGEPFVGKAGRMLDAILNEVNIKREDVFISNVFKCHPPFNSKPKVADLEMCAHTYLRKELQVVRPELIVCLGGLSAKVLLGDSNANVNNYRNQVHYTQGPLPTDIPFIVTYHPAATFHQDHLLEFIVHDLEWAKRLVAGELPHKKKKVNYYHLQSVFDIPGIREAKWIDLDLETDGLDPFIHDKEIFSLQISINENEGYYFDWNESVGLDLRQLLVRTVRVNGHNVKHDLKWLRTKAGIDIPRKVNDTLINLHLLDENFPDKSLDHALACFTDQKGHKDKFKKLMNRFIQQHKDKGERIRAARARLQKVAFYSIPVKTRIHYGAGDADGTGKLRRNFRPKLKTNNLLPLSNLMNNMVRVYTDIEYNGCRIDETLIHKLDRQYKKKIERVCERLNDLSPVEEMNYRSNPQLKSLLYDRWGCYPHTVKQGRKKVKYSTGKDALELILQDKLRTNVSQFIHTLLEYRKLTKLHGTYIEGMSEFLRDGYIHANWNLTGTDTGRTSCKDPNLQNIPRNDKQIKRVFVSRFGLDGRILQIDVSQGELRIAAQLFNEPTLLSLFRSGTADIHRDIAALSLRKDGPLVTEDERFNYKTINFAILFGSGIPTIHHNMKGASLDDAYRLVALWHKTFPRVKEAIDEIQRYVIANHSITNLFGRIYHLFVLDPNTDEGQYKLRKAVNSPIQGSLSDYNKLCGYTLWNRLNKFNREALMIGEVHDAWNLDIHKRHIKTIVPIIREVFENPDTSKFGFKFKVPMKVDIKIGPNWGDMEEIS